MKLNQRVRHLAEVLYENAGGSTNVINESLQQIDNIITKNAQFRSLIQSKRLTVDQKSEVIRNTFSGFVDSLVVEFLCIICKERSVQIIRQVTKTFVELYKERAGIVAVQVHVSAALTDESVKSLQNGLQQTLNKKTELRIAVDKQLLGGIKLRIENRFLDGSLKSQLERLQGELLQF